MKAYYSAKDCTASFDLLPQIHALLEAIQVRIELVAVPPVVEVLERNSRLIVLSPLCHCPHTISPSPSTGTGDGPKSGKKMMPATGDALSNLNISESPASAKINNVIVEDADSVYSCSCSESSWDSDGSYSSSDWDDSDEEEPTPAPVRGKGKRAKKVTPARPVARQAVGGKRLGTQPEDNYTSLNQYMR